jgi:hypothetical protein
MSEWEFSPGHNRFYVRFNLRCKECGAKVHKGEVAGYNDEQVVCEECFVCERSHCEEC